MCLVYKVVHFVIASLFKGIIKFDCIYSPSLLFLSSSVTSLCPKDNRLPLTITFYVCVWVHMCICVYVYLSVCLCLWMSVHNLGSTHEKKYMSYLFVLLVLPYIHLICSLATLHSRVIPLASAHSGAHCVLSFIIVSVTN